MIPEETFAPECPEDHFLPSYEQIENWFHEIPIDKEGNVQHFTAAQILQLLHGNPEQIFTCDAIEEATAIHPKQVEIICRQMELLHIIRQDPSDASSFQWNEAGNRNTVFRALVAEKLQRDRQHLLRLPIVEGKKGPHDVYYSKISESTPQT